MRLSADPSDFCPGCNRVLSRCTCRDESEGEVCLHCRRTLEPDDPGHLVRQADGQTWRYECRRAGWSTVPEGYEYVSTPRAVA